MLITSYGELPLLFKVLSDCYESTSKIKIIVFENEDLKILLDIIKKERFPKLEKVELVLRFRRNRYFKNYISEKKYYKSQVQYFKQGTIIDRCCCFNIYQNGFFFLFIKNYLDVISTLEVYEPVTFSENANYLSKISNLLRKILNFYIYDGSVTSKALGHKNIDIISDTLKNHEKVVFIGMQKSIKIKKSITLSDYFLLKNKYKVIFFEQPLINYGRLSGDSYTKFINSLRRIFEREIREKTFAVKLHPGNHTDKSYFKGIEVIERFIPSECLEQNSLIWLSVSSTAISHSTSEKVKKVSLIKYIDFKSAHVKETIMKNFKKNSFGEVIYPDSPEDLAKIKDQEIKYDEK